MTTQEEGKQEKEKQAGKRTKDTDCNSLLIYVCDCMGECEKERLECQQRQHSVARGERGKVLSRRKKKNCFFFSLNSK